MKFLLAESFFEALSAIYTLEWLIFSWKQVSIWVNEKEQEIPVPPRVHAPIKIQMRILIASGRNPATILAWAKGEFINKSQLKFHGRTGLRHRFGAYIVSSEHTFFAVCFYFLFLFQALRPAYCIDIFNPSFLWLQRHGSSFTPALSQVSTADEKVRACFPKAPVTISLLLTVSAWVVCLSLD